MIARWFFDTFCSEPQAYDHKPEDQFLVVAFFSAVTARMVLGTSSAPINAFAPKDLKVGLEWRLFGRRDRVCFWNGRHPG
jgi:hypothetical protein